MSRLNRRHLRIARRPCLCACRSSSAASPCADLGSASGCRPSSSNMAARSCGERWCSFWSRWLPAPVAAGIALISAAIAVGVELFRLVHAPWLDAFRLTLAGRAAARPHLLAWNMLAYGVGIVLAVLLDRLERGPSPEAVAFGRPLLLTPLTPPAETARTGAVPPRCDASAPCARPFARRADPVPFLHQQFPVLAVGLEIERGDDVVARPAPAARNSRTPAFPSAHRPRSDARSRRTDASACAG